MQGSPRHQVPLSTSHIPALYVVNAGFPALEDLSLAGCDAIGPLTIGAISRLPRLRSLNLDACHRIWGLGPLRRLTNLQKLDLGWCNAIGDEDAAAIASLSTLMELRICHTALTDTGVAKLSTLTGLVALSIGGLSVADATLAGLLRAMPYLRRLDLERCTEAGDTTLRALAATGPPLEELSLAYTNMSDDVFKVALPRLRRLRRLDLDSSGVGDAGVQGLAGLPDLEVLDLSDTGVTNAGMLVVGMLPFIAQVNLSFTGEEEGKAWADEAFEAHRTERRWPSLLPFGTF